MAVANFGFNAFDFLAPTGGGGAVSTLSLVWGFDDDSTAFEQDMRLQEGTDNVVQFSPSPNVPTGSKDLGSDDYELRVSQNQAGNLTDQVFPIAIVDQANGIMSASFDADVLSVTDIFYRWALYRITSGLRQCRGMGTLIIERTAAIDAT